MFAPNTHRRLPYVLAGAAFFVIFTILYNSRFHKTNWREHIQNIGLGEWTSSWQDEARFHLMPNFTEGVPKPPGSSYSKILVVPRLSTEDVDWMDEEIPDIDRIIYIADDPKAAYHVPENKGHEVMIYLTYIIDHYDKLPDIAIFMHSHRYAWHNSEVLGADASQMIKRLSPERVFRQGYVNMRCHWQPGCPSWMHPGETEYDEYKSEEILIAKAWAELFPLDPVPDVLAQPCCAQFALSRERIRTIPREKFQFYRRWLLHTPLKDFVSGRVWEYMWQYVFTGQSYWCPAEHECYCDGFGVCFGGKEQYDAWFDLRNQRDDLNGQLAEWERKATQIEEAKSAGRVEEAAAMEQPEEGMDAAYRRGIDAFNEELASRTTAAIERGRDPRNRAQEAGRAWHEGDGF